MRVLIIVIAFAAVLWYFVRRSPTDNRAARARFTGILSPAPSSGDTFPSCVPTQAAGVYENATPGVVFRRPVATTCFTACVPPPLGL